MLANGVDLLKLPLSERKERLSEMLADVDRGEANLIRYVELANGGDAVLRSACRLRLVASGPATARQRLSSCCQG
ncbi:hypothetical protein [Mesorhizobium helmanticense]|uniref:hypothetical protein n=1 Tax=Mesorhizobium helmanticense TaxID=1776423 RepID=UPI001FE08DD4|nr:hypothetical protein [Mesorhizobium helmanticense]